MSESKIILQPVEWNLLNDIDKTEVLNAQDSDCISELRDVLARHGKLNRFGITLLHSHFDLADDECLVEQVDAERRTLLTSVKKVSDLNDRAIATQWKLAETGIVTMARCVKWCEPRPGTTGHWQRHRREP